MVSTSRALREHVRECLEARREVNRRIDSVQTEMNAGFGESRRKIDERHAENQKSFEKLYSGLWKVALTILSMFAASYLAQHGFTAPGIGH